MIEILMPIDGTIHTQKEGNAPIFSFEGLTGFGLSIWPDISNDQIHSPIDGVLTNVSNRQLIIQQNDQLYALILSGELALSAAKYNDLNIDQKIKKGQLIGSVDMNVVKENRKEFDFFFLNVSNQHFIYKIGQFKSGEVISDEI